ncbi:MAG: rRNA maturation RNase YbeY [Neisseriaceae bacterium]|nr:rRNA maturation RNase YbeY [Neisseriaceae bacterium]MBP6861951.1 rRNA maturation RNase YbeY [Neisseriaceae bacterium]
MKAAKKRPFLAEQKKRLALDISRETAAETPDNAEFFKWVWQALKNEYRQAQIGIMICDEAEAQQYNRDYRGKDYATNVLSFALNEGDDFAEMLDTGAEPVLRGDLVLCTEVVAKEAVEQNISLTAHYAHLVIHGVLHLMGYDHEQDDEAEVMEALEIKVLHQLGYANPYSKE